MDYSYKCVILIIVELFICDYLEFLLRKGGGSHNENGGTNFISRAECSS